VGKYLNENEQLLVGNSIKCKNGKIDTDDMLNYIKQKPNRKTFGILFHNRVYNAWKNSDGKVGSWIKETIGEEPVIFDSTLQQKSVKQLEFYLRERGYYNSKITYSSKSSGIDNKKVKSKYFITTGNPHIISSISYNIQDSVLKETVQNSIRKNIVQKKERFNLSTLTEERKKATIAINNKGYYSFRENDIFYIADTSKKPEQVDITIGILPNKQYKQYKIRKTIVYPDYSANKKQQKTLIFYSKDSLTQYIYNDSLYVKPIVIERANYIKNGSFYNQSAVRKTQRRLSDNNLFKIVNISFEEVQSTDTLYGYIDCIIKITSSTQQAITTEIEGTNTAGDWGAELNLSYSHKNIAKGAENLQLKLTTAGKYDNALKTQNEEFKLFNTWEYGFEAKLSIPKLVSPIKPNKFDKNYKPTTNFRAAYNYIKTPDYIRPTSQFSYGYTWFGNDYLTHNLNPIDVSYIRYSDESERFLDFINSKDYYKYSYENYMIYSSNYSFIFYNRNPKAVRDYQYFKLYVESSGNLMNAASELLNAKKNEDDRFSTFNVVFAQYVKTEIDYRYYKMFDKNTSVVCRLFGGFAIPYSNSDWVPSVKKFYVGGANSLRAWPTKTLGPGSYQDTTSALKYYLGDIKLEANLEARFHMFWLLDGAVFLDVGNIWSNKANSLSGAAFNKATFLDEIAISTGYGFRFDFSFLIFRTDIGVKFREPAVIENSNSNIIWGNRKLQGSDFNLNIGIGYPF